MKAYRFNISMLRCSPFFHSTKNVQCAFMVRVIHVASNAFSVYPYHTHTPASSALFLVCRAIINSLHVLSRVHIKHKRTQVNAIDQLPQLSAVASGDYAAQWDSFIYYYRSSTSMNKIYNPFNNHYLNYRIDVCVCAATIQTEFSWTESVLLCWTNSMVLVFKKRA